MSLSSGLRFMLPAALAVATLLTATTVSHGQSPASAGDARIQTDVQKMLNHKQFGAVQVQVNDGVVTLSGQVDRYADKLEAERKIARDKEIASVHDLIQIAVGGEHVSDAELYAKLAKGLTYDRVGYGTTVFNSITLQVKDGVVVLGGLVYGPPDKDSALSLVAGTAGVRDIVDHLEVAPLSPNDNRIRVAEERAIYGYPALNRYALDPAKTIRISVVNGHVVLNGAVDNKGDRDLAGIRANGVPGVFSVVNNLQISGDQEAHR